MSRCSIQIGCCGADGPNDYMVMRQPLPLECRDTVTGNAFFNGCVNELTWFLEDKSIWAAIMAMILAAVHVRFLFFFSIAFAIKYVPAIFLKHLFPLFSFRFFILTRTKITRPAMPCLESCWCKRSDARRKQ